MFFYIVSIIAHRINTYIYGKLYLKASLFIIIFKAHCGFNSMYPSVRSAEVTVVAPILVNVVEEWTRGVESQTQTWAFSSAHACHGMHTNRWAEPSEINFSKYDGVEVPSLPSVSWADLVLLVPHIWQVWYSPLQSMHNKPLSQTERRKS